MNAGNALLHRVKIIGNHGWNADTVRLLNSINAVVNGVVGESDGSRGCTGFDHYSVVGDIVVLFAVMHCNAAGRPGVERNLKITAAK
ncbi:hypothetical protein SDC9_166990 [bioreactor metagenome]|uniref:Uncharacterized protein n=1 Tax=bioreactor metagenome TaxID=1076179 RepID=A0A645FYJ2_9ZZZZ